MTKKIVFTLLFLILSAQAPASASPETQISSLAGKILPSFLNFLYSEEENPTEINRLIEYFDWNSIFKRSGIVVNSNNSIPLAKHYLLDVKRQFRQNRVAIEDQMHLDTIRTYVTEDRIEKLFFLISSLDPEYQLEVSETETVLHWRGLTLHLSESSKKTLQITGFQFND